MPKIGNKISSCNYNKCPKVNIGPCPGVFVTEVRKKGDKADLLIRKNVAEKQESGKYSKRKLLTGITDAAASLARKLK